MACRPAEQSSTSQPAMSKSFANGPVFGFVLGESLAELKARVTEIKVYKQDVSPDTYIVSNPSAEVTEAVLYFRSEGGDLRLTGMNIRLQDKQTFSDYHGEMEARWGRSRVRQDDYMTFATWNSGNAKATLYEAGAGNVGLEVFLVSQGPDTRQGNH
jgi:hypothetical protein